MNNKNIIIAGVIAVGLYLFSQMKKIQHTTTAQKIAQKIAQKVAQKVVKEKDEYVRERTPPTPATTIKKRTGVPTSEARRIAEKIVKDKTRKQRERIAAAHRAVLERARRKRIQIAEANRKAAARKNLIHRAVEVLPGVSLHNLLNVIKPPNTKKTRQKTSHSSWAPTSWPVHIVHKKSKLFDYSKPQKDIDLSVLHTAIKWRRARTQPKPKHRIQKAAELPSNMRTQNLFPKWRSVGPRRWPHIRLRQR